MIVGVLGTARVLVLHHDEMKTVRRYMQFLQYAGTKLVDEDDPVRRRIGPTYSSALLTLGGSFTYSNHAQVPNEMNRDLQSWRRPDRGIVVGWKGVGVVPTVYHDYFSSIHVVMVTDGVPGLLNEVVRTRDTWWDNQFTLLEQRFPSPEWTAEGRQGAASIMMSLSVPIGSMQGQPPNELYRFTNRSIGILSSASVRHLEQAWNFMEGPYLLATYPTLFPVATRPFAPFVTSTEHVLGFWPAPARTRMMKGFNYGE